MIMVASPFVSVAHELLKKPLIVGASVSAGYGTQGPGDRSPDGLHLADAAGEFLADQLYQLPVFR